MPDQLTRYWVELDNLLGSPRGWCQQMYDASSVDALLAEQAGEIARLREQRDNEAWKHAACLTIAETGQKWGDNVEPSAAMKAVYNLQRELAAANAVIGAMRAGMRKELNCDKSDGDLLDEFGVFLDHHQEKERLLRQAKDDLFVVSEQLKGVRESRDRAEARVQELEANR